MQLIDEQYVLTVGLLNFTNDGFQAFLKLTAKLCSGDQSAKVESNYFTILQRLWNIAGYNSLRQTFYDRCFTNTCFTDKNWVVLRASS